MYIMDHHSHTHVVTQYGTKVQYKETDYSSPLLNNKGTTEMKNIMEKVLFYARMAESTILERIRDLYYDQDKGTKKHNWWL